MQRARHRDERRQDDGGEESSELPSRELASKKDYQLNQALNLLKGMQIMRSSR